VLFEGSAVRGLQMAETKAAPKPKEPITVERKLEMALSDIEKARPRQRKNVKAKKEAEPGAKAAEKSGKTREKRQKKLAGKRDQPQSGSGVVVTKKGAAGKAGAGKAGAAGKAKADNSGLPRIVIKVDLTKVGNDKKKPQQPKKKQGDGKRKPQQPKVVLH